MPSISSSADSSEASCGLASGFLTKVATAPDDAAGELPAWADDAAPEPKAPAPKVGVVAAILLVVPVLAVTLIGLILAALWILVTSALLFRTSSAQLA